MIYLIPKHWHFSIPLIPRCYLWKKLYKWKAVLYDSCKYEIGEDQSDWNKLVGVSNHINPRKRSVRFVWRYNDETNMFDIGIYKETDEQFTSHVLCSVNPGEPIEMDLVFTKHFVTATVNHKTCMFPFLINKFTWRLNPYFGGNRKAPHNMFLKLK